MPCKGMEYELLRLRENEATPAERERLERHLAQCESCRVWQESLQRNRTWLQAQPGATPSANLAQQAVQVWQAEQRRVAQRPWFARPAVWAMSAVGATALAGGLYILPHRAAPKVESAKQTFEASQPALTPNQQEFATTPPKEKVQQRERDEATPERKAPPPTLQTAKREGDPIKTLNRIHPVQDTLYLNGEDPALLEFWSGSRNDRAFNDWFKKRLPPFKDDFAQPPAPMIAGTDDSAVRAAKEAYEQEAAVVDTRLFRKVTLQEKGVSLEDLCTQLRAQTGVAIRASRAVRDEKATVFVKDLPARDVMRSLARLFNYSWSRNGETGKYDYEFVKSMRVELAEEEMRSRDIHAAMLALDEAMQKRIAQKASLPKGSWDGAALDVYGMLSPAERAALLDGKNRNFAVGHSDPALRLPNEWRNALLDSGKFRARMVNGKQELVGGGFEDHLSTPLKDIPDAMPTVSLQIDRSELGTLALKNGIGAYIGAHNQGQGMGMGAYAPLVVGKSPSVASPKNAEANKELLRDPRFKKTVSFAPKSSCPHLGDLAGSDDETAFYTDNEGATHRGAEPPHLVSSDAWEEVHRKTGLNIVADYYSRLFTIDSVTVREKPLYDALSQVGDALSVRWKKEGDVLLCRSVSHFWDRLKEVPNRTLARWSQEAKTPSGLPIASLFEMASLSDTQLNSLILGRYIGHCAGLPEWWLAGRGPFRVGSHSSELLRSWVRFAATLAPGQREKAGRPDGIAFAELTPAQQEACVQVNRSSLEAMRESRIRIEYLPSGRYVWEPIAENRKQSEEWMRFPLAHGKTREEALAAAQRLVPGAKADDIKPCEGRFVFKQFFPNGVTYFIGQSVSFRNL